MNPKKRLFYKAREKGGSFSFSSHFKISGICDRMSQNCRAIALAKYPIELQAQRYIELYHQVLNRQTRSEQKVSA
jgi:hypothetical protein